MLYAVICHDRAGMHGLRAGNRQAHLDYLSTTGVVKQAGPFLDESGEMCGSLIILETDSLAAAEAWAAADPYAKSGLFQRVEVRPWDRVVV
jgi:uncharacterized protein